MSIFSKHFRRKAFNNYLLIGDRVAFIYRPEGDSPSSPVWGGKHGFVAGTVTGLDKSAPTAEVAWDNGERSCWYADKHRRLTLIERLRHPANSGWPLCKSNYLKYIGLAALVVAVDHFVLKGACRNSIKSTCKKFVDKVFCKVEQSIDETV